MKMKLLSSLSLSLVLVLSLVAQSTPTPSTQPSTAKPTVPSSTSPAPTAAQTPKPALVQELTNEEKSTAIRAYIYFDKLQISLTEAEAKVKALTTLRDGAFAEFKDNEKAVLTKRGLSPDTHFINVQTLTVEAIAKPAPVTETLAVTSKP